MIKCSFCERPLVCKTCGFAFRPRQSDTYVGVFQPDTEVHCPECAKVLTCKSCGYVFGDPEEEPETK